MLSGPLTWVLLYPQRRWASNPSQMVAASESGELSSATGTPSPQRDGCNVRILIARRSIHPLRRTFEVVTHVLDGEGH